MRAVVAGGALCLSLALASAAQPAEPMNPLPPVLTAEEAASLLRVDPETLELMVAAGTVPARRIRLEDGSEITRFGRDALLAWLQASPTRRDEATADAARPGIGDEILGEEPEGTSSTEVFLREQGVMGTAGTFSLDLGTFYARQDGEVLIVDDNPRLATATGRTALLQGVLRYTRNDTTAFFVRAGAERLDSRLRLGDGYLGLDGANSRTSLAAGMRRTLRGQQRGRPEVIVGVEGRLPTGTSSIGLGASASLVKNLDPAVVFGSVAYAYVDGESFSDATLLESRHSLNLDIGYALALNDRFSINFSMEAGYRSRTRFDDALLLDDDFAGLQFGMTIQVSPSLHVQPVVGYSLTGGGYSIGVSIPIDFHRDKRGSTGRLAP